jgi:drug/metabolite transporter (DMT)-like permease
VNPTVAVLLGWMIYHESFGVREAIAMGVIFVGVAMVKRASTKFARTMEPIADNFASGE